MAHTRAVFLLVILVCIGIVVAEFDYDKEDGHLTKKEFLEDVLTVISNKEKRARCANRKSVLWCKRTELFFHSCKDKIMKKFCRAACRLCG
ncbi:hypothetical protein OS493_023721 [Desmophyllum pertusum]|uniref:ShKT domain-containing protein n=1 Tax=Desmophyllum pertusum TaxID=174260 RepID=A0A9W9YYF0_9CNID|nr:hypothetical protein OS493_023721 [Desmophyllum pertusum]